MNEKKAQRLVHARKFGGGMVAGLGLAVLILRVVPDIGQDFVHPLGACAGLLVLALGILISAMPVGPKQADKRPAEEKPAEPTTDD